MKHDLDPPAPPPADLSDNLGIAPTTASLAILVIVAVAAAWAHEGVRALQVWALALPVIVWLWWPIQRVRWQRARRGVVVLTIVLFIVDSAIRAYLNTVYGAGPESSLVLSAIANTHLAESGEYLGMYGTAILRTAAIAAAAIAACVWLSGRPRAPLKAWIDARPRRYAVYGITGLLLLASVAGHLLKPWVRWHPVAFWPDWISDVVALRESWVAQADEREQESQEAARIHPRLASEQPATVVLVIGDSVNRDNMQLYGYARETTPQLMQRQLHLADQFTVFRHAWSTMPGTLSAMERIFNFGETSTAAVPHLLALAQIVGYKVWWVSNHNDLAIEQLHASFSDEVRVTNRIPGRSTVSLDTEALPAFKEALADPSPHKLIVVHLLGAHPRYRLRYPAQTKVAFQQSDAVERKMEHEGRSLWLRHMRAEYDTAIAFHDYVISKMLDLTMESLSDDRYGAWVFMSDHGQEVGHELDHAGHAPHSAAGYKIPLVIWQNQPRTELPPNAGSRPFRSDWTAWTLATLLNINWPDRDPSRDVLSADYTWVAPSLPFKFEN